MGTSHRAVVGGGQLNPYSGVPVWSSESPIVYDFYFFVEGRHCDPEPQAPPYTSVLVFRFGYYTIEQSLESGHHPRDPSKFVRWYDLTLRLRRPEWYYLQSGRGILICRDGFYAELEAENSEFNFTLDIADPVNIGTYLLGGSPVPLISPSSFPLAGIFLRGEVVASWLQKLHSDGAVTGSSELRFGYRYQFEPDGAWHTLPVDIDTRPHQITTPAQPIYEGTHTGSARIKVFSYLYNSGSGVEEGYSQRAELVLRPKIERQFRRQYRGDTSLLGVRGTHPRITHTRARFTSNTFTGRYEETIRPQRGHRRLILANEPNTAEQEVFQSDIPCPYSHLTHYFYFDPYGSSYSYSDNCYLEGHRTDLWRVFDPTNPMFAIFLGGTGGDESVTGTGTGNHYPSSAKTLIDTESYYNWLLWYPSVLDPDHWTVGVPLELHTAGNYWQRMRTQYLHHAQHPSFPKYRSRPLDAVLLDCGNVTSVRGAVFNELRQTVAIAFPQIAECLYTLDEFGDPGTGNHVWTDHIGLANPRKYTVSIPNEKRANLLERYQLENATATLAGNTLTVTPTSNEVRIKYQVGSWTQPPYLYDLIATQFLYAVSGSEVQSVQVVFKDSEGNEVEVASGLSGTVRYEFGHETDIYVGSHARDFVSQTAHQLMGRPEKFDEGTDLDSDGRSAPTIADPLRGIAFQWLCAPAPYEIEFRIQLRSIQPFQFETLRFQCDGAETWNGIHETGNRWVLYRSRQFLRFGGLCFLDPNPPHNDTQVRQVPLLKEDDYRTTIVDLLCYLKLLTGEGYSDDSIREECESLFHDLEPYNWYIDPFGEEGIIIDRSESTKAFAYFTFAIPLLRSNNDYDAYTAQALQWEFWYGNSLAQWPPIDTLPQVRMDENGNPQPLTKQPMILYAPYRYYIASANREVGLYRVNFQLGDTPDDDTEIDRQRLDTLASRIIPRTNWFVREYTRALTNEEVVRGWDDQPIRTPKYYLVELDENGQRVRDLARVSLLGHSYLMTLSAPAPPAPPPEVGAVLACSQRQRRLMLVATLDSFRYETPTLLDELRHKMNEPPVSLAAFDRTPRPTWRLITQVPDSDPPQLRRWVRIEDEAWIQEDTMPGKTAQLVIVNEYGRLYEFRQLPNDTIVVQFSADFGGQWSNPQTCTFQSAPLVADLFDACYDARHHAFYLAVRRNDEIQILVSADGLVWNLARP